MMMTFAKTLDQSILNGTISNVRILLSALVILIHCAYSPFFNIENSDSFLSGVWLFDAVARICSFVYFSAVPAFFVISGFLFFKGGEFSLELYKRKLKSRFYTLLLPYIFWNLLVLLWGIMTYTISALRGGNDLKNAILLFFKDWTVYDIFVAGKIAQAPYYLIMWYVRDLIALVIMSPLIYFVIKKFKWCIVLLALLLVCTEFQWHWIRVFPIFYFCFGAWLSITKIDVEKIFEEKKYFIVLLILLVVFCVTLVFYDVPSAVINGVRILMVVYFFYMSYCFTKRYKVIFPLISGASFFVYCTHGLQLANNCALLSLAAIILKYTIGYIPIIGYTASFLLTPLLTYCFCFGLYMVMDKFCPNFLRFVAGNMKTARASYRK